jgi:predicted HD superfamily hydrolase involved in NAD metabolism
MGKRIQAQIKALQVEFEKRPKGLREHVGRVLIEALDLAIRWDVSAQRTELAVWGHDLFRALPPRDQLRLAADVGVAIGDEDRAAPVMLHGPNAAVVLRERFGVRDEEALAAIRDHTTGAPEMPLVSKILLLADKFERRKRARTPIMAEIRKLARRDLDLALLCWADWKWVLERERGWSSYPAHWDARRLWVSQHHEEIALPGRTALTSIEAE